VGKILVVDDSKTIRAQVSSILTQGGFETIEAADGLEGLALLDRVSDVAMIICDVNMPRMDGLEMVEALQKMGRKLPIVMLTTEGQPRLIERARKAGALGWIVKSFNPEMLLAAVRKVTGSMGSAMTAAGPSDSQWAMPLVSNDVIEKGSSQTSSDRLSAGKRSPVTAEAAEHLRSDGVLGVLCRAVFRTSAWLKSFRELVPDPRAEVVTMLDNWVTIMTESLEYEVAGVFECDFENGRLVPWLGQASASTQQDMVPPGDNQPFLFASPVGRPASFFSREVEWIGRRGRSSWRNLAGSATSRHSACGQCSESLAVCLAWNDSCGTCISVAAGSVRPTFCWSAALHREPGLRRSSKPTRTTSSRLEGILAR
jgi:two-component system chemotaxis response regulator CheY